ncbi:MAG: hypothetical protein JW395_0796 [Nitrospira sp.]|nr:hypothetical protein [Nitrospira sp.]
MYVQYERLPVTMGMQKPAEDRVPEVIEIQKRMPGFRSTHFMRGMGDLSGYLAVRVWGSREALQNFARNPDFAEFNKKRPTNLYSGAADMEFYDVAHEEWGKATPKFAWCREFHLGHGNGRAWEEYEQGVYPVLRESAGFSGVQHLRYWGNGDNYVQLTYWDTVESLFDFLAASTQWRESMAKDLLHEPSNDQLYYVAHYHRMPE